MTATPHATVPTLLAGPALVGGFATAVAIWGAAFIGHSPGLAFGDPLIRVTPVLLIGVIGAVLVGRSLARQGASLGSCLAAGGLAGLVTGLLNLIILGSVIAASSSEQGFVSGALGYVVGYLIFAPCVGAIGGLLGSRLAAPQALTGPQDSRDWLARFGVVNALAIVPLLFVGGLVTSSASGMAFPDWPTSNGRAMFLYPLSLMMSDYKQFYEHSHRLFGMLVGISTITLTVYTLVCERRAWVKGAAIGLLVLVIGQGVLGGQGRVVGNSPLMGMLHGILGQLTFGAAVALAACLGRGFREATSTGVRTVSVTVAALLLASLVLQLGLGAAYRHLGHKHVMFTHAVTAILPTIFAAIAGFSAARGKAGSPAERGLARLGKGLIHTTSFQWILGIAAFVAVLAYPATATEDRNWIRIITGTVHHFNGAIILALASLAAVWAVRLAPSRAAPPVAQGAPA